LGASGLPFFYYHTQKRTQKRKTPARFLNAAGRKNITPPGAKIFAKALSVFVLYFRWHDAGDIQSIKHFKNIVEVANKTPAITHWIPTREHKIINDFIKARNTIPDNLIVRISATNIDGKPPKNASHTSTVHSKSKAIGFECKAPSQGGSCLDCRACWDTNIKNVSYKQH
jgi:hypothetical protein